MAASGIDVGKKDEPVMNGNEEWDADAPPGLEKCVPGRRIALRAGCSRPPRRGKER
jgi:hypothetical protein